MIEIERRLQHAARELREVEIDPPPFDRLGGPRRPSGIARIPALVMPVLFVLGGLAVVAGGLNRQGDVPEAAPAAPPPAVQPVTVSDADEGAASAPVLTVHQEIALISSLGPASNPPAPSSAPKAASSPDDMRTLSQRYR